MEYEQIQTAMEAEEDIDFYAQNKCKTEFEDLYCKNVALAEKNITPNYVTSESTSFQLENKNDQFNTAQKYADC